MLPPTFSRSAPCRRVPAKQLDPLTPLSARAIPSVGWTVLLSRGAYWTHNHYSLILQQSIHTSGYSIISDHVGKPSNGKPSLNAATHHNLRKQLLNSTDMKTFWHRLTNTLIQTASATSQNGSTHTATPKNIALNYSTYFSNQIQQQKKTNSRNAFYKTLNSPTPKSAYKNSKHEFISKRFTDFTLAGFRYLTHSPSQMNTTNKFSLKAVETFKTISTASNMR